MLVGLGLSLVSDTSGNCQHIFNKNGLMDGRRRTPKISRPAGQDFGPADMGGWGVGGGAARQNFGGSDLSDLGPFKAEANLGTQTNTHTHMAGQDACLENQFGTLRTLLLFPVWF